MFFLDFFEPPLFITFFPTLFLQKLLIFSLPGPRDHQKRDLRKILVRIEPLTAPGDDFLPTKVSGKARYWPKTNFSSFPTFDLQKLPIFSLPKPRAYQKRILHEILRPKHPLEPSEDGFWHMLCLFQICHISRFFLIFKKVAGRLWSAGSSCVYHDRHRKILPLSIMIDTITR